MFYEFDKLIALMQRVAKEINGYYFGNKALKQFGVIKDDYVFQYRFPDRDNLATFSVMTSMPLPKPINIRIDRYNKISLSKRYYMNELFDIVIGDGDKKFAEKMVDGLLDDYEFMNNFKELFDKDDIIDISENTICIYKYRPIESAFASVGVMSKDDLIRMMNVIKEIKIAIQYYINRINPQ